MKNVQQLFSFLVALACAFVLAGVGIAVVDGCENAWGADEKQQDDKDNWSDAQWEAYDKAASKGECEAGHSTMPSGKMPKSWKNDKHKSPADGIRVGLKWCGNPKMKCYKNIVSRMKSRRTLYGGWWNKYKGGIVEAELLLVSVTENPKGSLNCSWDRNKWECGVTGVKRGAAKSCGCNICHPECAIACAARLRNLNRLNAYKLFPALKWASKKDQYLISGLFSSPGSGFAKAIISQSGALDIMHGPDNPGLLHDAPYEWITKWYSGKSNKNLKKLFSFGKLITYYRGGIRIGLQHGFMQAAMRYYGVDAFEDIPRKDKYTVIKIPPSLPPYPGDKLHGKCWLPEFIAMTRKLP